MTGAARVCVIGSGVAGGVVCQELLDGGVQDVLMLEAGGPAVMRDLRTWHDVYMRNDGDNPLAHRIGYVRGDYETVGDKFPLFGGRARGGTTLLWGGDCLRLKPEDFKLHTLTGRGADWPLSYDDLEPFYATAERTLQVSGEASDEGHPPRSGPFPLPAFQAQDVEETFITAMAKLGYATQHNCVARNSRAINGMPQCQTTGTCGYCPIGGRFTGDQLIDRLEARPGFRLLVNKAVLKIELRSRSGVTALQVLDRLTGKIERIEAGKIVVCAGAIESAKLLLASANAWWPAGLGNSSDLVGRHLMNHFSVAAAAMHPNSSGGARQLAFSTVVSRHFDSEKMQRDGKFLLAPYYPWPKVDRMLANGDDSSAVLRRRSEPIKVFLTAWGEQFPEPSNRLVLGSGSDSLGLPKLKVQYKRSGSPTVQAAVDPILKAMGCTKVDWGGPDYMAHMMGTCRMATNEGAGVVDRDLRVHGIDDLYVCSSAVFPTGGAANPTLTIAALAHRLGKHLRTRV